MAKPRKKKATAKKATAKKAAANMRAAQLFAKRTMAPTLGLTEYGTRRKRGAGRSGTAQQSHSFDAAIKADQKRQNKNLTSHQKRSNKILGFAATVMAGAFGPQGVRAKGRQMKKAMDAWDRVKGAGTTKGGRVKRGTFIKKF